MIDRPDPRNDHDNDPGLMWRWNGRERPPFAEPTGPGQESVWDYPRPPKIVPDGREVVVTVDGVEIARTRRALRICETASPPTFYLPPDDVDRTRLVPARGTSRCEWKGLASYWTIVTDAGRHEMAAWSYERPLDDASEIKGHLAFYPNRVACWVDGERVSPQPGRFYGGWITKELTGPFKGEPGTEGW